LEAEVLGVVTETNGRVFPGRAALFLDRDGVINERIAGGYIVELAQLRILEAFLAAFGDISRHWDGPIVLISNQACVGKGLLDEAGLRAIMQRTVELLGEHGIDVAAWYCCPHAPGDGCTCRKPLPGMFALCAEQLGVRVERSCFVGDTDSDEAAGSAAGCATYIVDTAVPESFAAARAFVDRALAR
jgi:D-glycero-D-manno-heptose 1,7-bisphosphate phosphatase